MKDYKGIHDKIRQRDYYYREGWADELVGRGIVIGILVCVVIAAIGAMV